MQTHFHKKKKKEEEARMALRIWFAAEEKFVGRASYFASSAGAEDRPISFPVFFFFFSKKIKIIIKKNAAGESD